jgi:hypothetical protein
MAPPRGVGPFWKEWGPKLEELVQRGMTDEEIADSGIIPGIEMGTTISNARRRLKIPAGEQFRDNRIAAYASGPDLPTPEQPQVKRKVEPFTTPPAYVTGNHVVIESRPDNTYVFGAVGDKHIGSKYHREDVLADLYRRFERAGAMAVFDTGNWVDGDARFNKHDVTVTGLDRQTRLMAEIHPRIEGVTTYAVWGDDHEGWYAQREGIDVGRYAEDIMRSEGHLWHNLGFMEAHVVLRNVNTGVEVPIAVCHPGGGSAYALSYKPQKIVEAMEGGEKPAALLLGHYHKMSADNIRNVWVVQTGTAEDQTPFMRKRSIAAHVGGVVLRFEQDPETGALIGCDVGMVRYFNRGYYNNRWSMTGEAINRADRLAA